MACILSQNHPQALEDHASAIFDTACKISARGKGVFGADQLDASLRTPFSASGVTPSIENIQKYRELLLSAPGIEQHLSCIIVYRELIEQQDTYARQLLNSLISKGVIIGVKIDSVGLDNLLESCHALYNEGVRMVTWRAVFRIAEQALPTEVEIIDGAKTLAKYASIAQGAGLVPMLNPEVLDDGDHSLELSWKLHERILCAVFEECRAHGVLLQAVLLKTSWVRPGVEAVEVPAKVTARATMEMLSRVVPSAVPFVGLLSGGWSEADVTLHLNEIQKLKAIADSHWNLTFTLGRALQASVIDVWGGRVANEKGAQQMLKDLCEVNAQAVSGKLGLASKHPSVVTRSLHEENYQH